MGELVDRSVVTAQSSINANTDVLEKETLLGGEVGKRLIPHIIDATAAATPDADCLLIPRTPGKPSDGWKPVSWAEVANAVNYVAHMLIREAGTPTPGAFPTIAYIGLDDPRYVLFIMGAIKAGFKALFISPRNSVEAQVNLFNKTDCDLLYHDQAFAAMAKPWVAGRTGMKSVVTPAWDEWVSTPVEPFPYPKTFEEAEWDPFVVLHTSGSTGLPKPVIIPQGSLALNDAHRYLSDEKGNFPWLPTFAKFENPRYLCTCPLFHTAGIAPTVISGFYFSSPVIFRDPSVPLTGDNVVQWLQNSGAGYTVLPPAILEQMSRSQEALDELKKLHVVVFGGGPLAPAPAASLLANDIKLVNAIGATEFIYMPYYTQPDSSLWEWFIVPTELIGIEWRPFGEDTYEQVFIRQDKERPGLQGCFYVFPEEDEYSTKDLYRRHPSLPNHWTYVGRADDIIVFSTGEKLNPTTIEGAVIGHAGVRGAQVVGAGQFHAALLIEPAQQPADEQEKQRFLDDVWPIIEKVNEQTVAHGRILRDYVFLSDPERPFPRAGKGTIQRAMATKLYADDIRRIFAASSDTNGVAVTGVELDLSSQAAFADGIRQLVQKALKLPGLGFEDDFFTAGVDSLQVLQLARVLSASVDNPVEARTIYSHPTIAQLSSSIYSQSTSNLNGVAESDTISLCHALVDKYTQNLPLATPNKPPPSSTNQTIIITGTTGALGCYLLDLALANPEIAHIICFNRTSDARERQIAASSSRGLSTDFEPSRVEFLTVDLSTSATFTLPQETISRLAGSVDRIIHNAWPVDFNQSIASFEPHLRGVRHLIDFAASAAKRIPITFVSSVSTVEQWDAPGPIPEDSLSDFTHAAPIGYGQSKLAASLILDAASSSSSSGVPRNIVRVGQVAGPRAEKGQWNPREWLPSLIRSSLYLGLLPAELGVLRNMGWAPVEDIAGVVVEVAARSGNVEGGYFHAVNPSLPDWEGVILPALREFYGERIEKVVSLEEWVEALAKSAEDAQVDVERNPGVKLLDTYRLAATKAKDGQESGAGFATVKTEEASETMRRMEPVTAELMKRCPHAQVAADGASATTGASGSPLADTAQAQTQTQAETERPPKEANPPFGKEPAAKPSQGSGRPLQPKPRPKPKEPKSRSPGSQIPKGRDPHPSHRQESLARISGLQPDAPLRGLARQGILRKGTTIHLNIGACDINALLVILFIIHAQPQRLPRQLDVQTLANVALIAEFYQCGIVRSFSGGWHDAVKDYKLPDRYCPDLLQLLWDSYYFRWTGCFNAYSMSFPGFPIPEQIVDALNTSRESALNKVLKHTYATRDRLTYDAGILGDICRHECCLVMLRSLSNAMHSPKLGYVQPTTPYHGLSCTDVKVLLRAQSTNFQRRNVIPDDETEDSATRRAQRRETCRWCSEADPFENAGLDIKQLDLVDYMTVS
ncbi:hypothetical protein HK57_00616 [Aspergillus ustus]|uniref:Carrier domain-containing protein n=1 Tax=Aspergillus ustus TaxID=40382 RepID=A0A0C1E247_ASPUT|nr:hypothetical protein HK57_00616 [Aspergillus ustus]